MIPAAMRSIDGAIHLDAAAHHKTAVKAAWQSFPMALSRRVPSDPAGGTSGTLPQQQGRSPEPLCTSEFSSLNARQV